MILELYILFEVVMIGVFIGAFFAKQEIMWAVSAVLSGVLMMTSYSIEIVGYIYNETTSSYFIGTTSFSYPYLMAINMIFFGLTLLLGLFDLYDKYGNRLGE